MLVTSLPLVVAVGSVVSVISARVIGLVGTAYVLPATLVARIAFASTVTMFPTGSALSTHDVSTEVFPALTVRCLDDRSAQLALSGLGAAVHVPVYRDESGENPFVLRVVVYLVAVDALTRYTAQLVTSWDTVTGPIATRDTRNPTGAAGLVSKMS